MSAPTEMPEVDVPVKIPAGWIHLYSLSDTYVMRVPNGMIVRYGDYNSRAPISMAFVPCETYEFRSFLMRHGAV